MKIETWTQVGVLGCAALVACGGSDDVVAADAAIQTPKVVVQDCSTDDQTGCPDGYKCGLYVYNSTLRHACLLLSGSVGEGQVCSPSQDGMFDDCGPGLICSLQVGSTTVCERLCTGPAACGPGRACFVKFMITDGRCLPGGCDLFDTGSCASDRTCESGLSQPDQVDATSCRLAGPLAKGDRCSLFQSECGRGLTCAPSCDAAVEGCLDNEFGKCTTHCDATHPCAGGSCITVEKPPGYCLAP